MYLTYLEGKRPRDLEGSLRIFAVQVCQMIRTQLEQVQEYGHKALLDWPLCPFPTRSRNVSMRQVVFCSLSPIPVPAQSRELPFFRSSTWPAGYRTFLPIRDFSWQGKKVRPAAAVTVQARQDSERHFEVAASRFSRVSEGRVPYSAVLAHVVSHSIRCLIFYIRACLRRCPYFFFTESASVD